jgi:hypothetical protein
MSLSSKSSPTKSPSPEERIAALRADLGAEIDRRATALKETMPGVPFMVVRNILTRHSECRCAAFLHIRENEA